MFRRWRERFFARSGEVAMRAPETEAAGKMSDLSLVEDALVGNRVVFELRPEFTGQRLDFRVRVVVVLNRERAGLDKRWILAKAAAKFDAVTPRIQLDDLGIEFIRIERNAVT